jgi:hypothetical protein
MVPLLSYGSSDRTGSRACLPQKAISCQITNQLTCDTTWETREPAMVWWMHRTEGWSQLMAGMAIFR